MQRDQFRPAQADAGPDDARPTWIREAADAVDAEHKALVAAAHHAYCPANRQQLALVHFAQEKQRDVQILHLDPFHVGAAFGKVLLQCHESVAQRLTEINGDKSAQAVSHERTLSDEKYHKAAKHSSQNCRVP